jgi:hypothetical protein
MSKTAREAVSTLWDYANGEGATSDDVAEIYGEMVNAALKE